MGTHDFDAGVREDSEGVRAHMLMDNDHAVRSALARRIAALGHAPTNDELALQLGLSPDELEAALIRLHRTHALLLHPHTVRPWVVHPFALSAGSCWVQTGTRGYWANCLYCAFGISAALQSDAVISTRLGGESEPVRYFIRDGQPAGTSDIFHLSTPAAQWWGNVIAACASFQPFRKEQDVDDWCARHAMPRGETMTIPALWRFASDWYGGYLEESWRKRTPHEVRAVLARNGLTSSFWELS